MEFINEHTRKCLDVDYIIGKIKPITPYGKSLKMEMEPFRPDEKDRLLHEFDLIDRLIICLDKNDKEICEIRSKMEDIKEIRGSLKRCAAGQTLNEIDIFEIKSFLFTIGDIIKIQNKVEDIPSEFMLSRNEYLEKLLDPFGDGIKSFYIYDCYSELLKKVRDDKKRLQSTLNDEIRRVQSLIGGTKEDGRSKSIIKHFNLIGVDNRYSREIVIVNSDKKSLEAIKNSDFFEIVRTGMYHTVFHLKENTDIFRINTGINELSLLEGEEEKNILIYLSKEIKREMENLSLQVDKLGRFDIVLAKARFAVEIKGVHPEIVDEKYITMANGRHLRLEEILEKQLKEFIPISIDAGSGVTVITGTNMGGKTVSLKIAGILCFMAQLGLFVPGEKFKMPLFEYIYFSMGDNQSIHSGLSTFASEIRGMLDILDREEEFGLILIDELARGTNPGEGCAISKSIIKHLNKLKSITLFTTHFDCIVHGNIKQHLRVRGLKKLKEYNKRGIESGGIDNISTYMDYSLEKVELKTSVPRDAINIARLLGLNNEILSDAEKFLEEMEDKDGKAES